MPIEDFQMPQLPSTMKDHCPDCGVPIGEKHEDGCDVERCPHCGGQALGCVGFYPNDPRRQPWDGRWPGEVDAERLGFFIGGDRSCPISTACLWNAAGIPTRNGGSTTYRQRAGGERTDESIALSESWLRSFDRSRPVARPAYH
jgi:hypothetical protein